MVYKWFKNSREQGSGIIDERQRESADWQRSGARTSANQQRSATARRAGDGAIPVFRANPSAVLSGKDRGGMSWPVVPARWTWKAGQTACLRETAPLPLFRRPVVLGLDPNPSRYCIAQGVLGTEVKVPAYDVS